MKLSISNIAWANEFDQEMYETIKNMGFQGIEIAPSRIFGLDPYQNTKNWLENFKKKYGLEISSIQSIWYGRAENMFSSPEEYDILLGVTKKALSFASSMECKNVVFGCPKGRTVPKTMDRTEAFRIFENFAREVVEFAKQNQTVFALEANPEIYGTNFLVNVFEASSIVNAVGSEYCKINLDLGELLYNIGDNDSDETNRKILKVIDMVYPNINHIHISEPYLGRIKKRNLHSLLFDFLKERGYKNYVSIEMRKQDLLMDVKEKLEYIKELTYAV